MTASAVIQIASAEHGSVPGTATGAPRGHVAGLMTDMPQSSQTGAQGFGSSLRSLLASVGITEDGVETTAKAFPALADAAQPQSARGIAGASASRSGLPPAPASQQPQCESAARTNTALLLSNHARPAVEPGRASVQAPAGHVTDAFKAGTLESDKRTCTGPAGKDARKEPHSAKPVQMAPAQPSGPIAIAVPAPAQPVRVPAQVRASPSIDAEPRAESAVITSRPRLQVFSTGAETATLPGAGSGRAPHTKPTSGPAFDQATEATFTAPDVHVIGTGKEPTVESGALQRTSQGATHTLSPGSSIVTSSAGHEKAGKPPVSSGSSTNPQKEAAEVIAPAATEEKRASGDSGVANKMAERHARANTLHASTAQAVHPSASQTSVAAPSQPGMTVARDASVANIAGDAKGSGGLNSGSPPAGTEGPSAHETFAALDAAGSANVPTWTHASAHHAEAGFQDPALGWVAVRAQVDGSGIHAALVPGSTDAARSLGTHLAGLNAYLAEHHTPVATLTLAAHESQWAGQGMGQGSGQNPGQGEQSRQQADVRESAFEVATPGRSRAAVGADGAGAPSAESAPGGVYISVMA